MGFCGCTNKTSVVTAGIMALLQSGMGLILNIYFLTLFFGFEGTTPFQSFGADKDILLEVTRTQYPLIRGLLITATVLHIAWFISSVAVLVGNSRDNITALRQWVAVTVIIIVGDILFPVLLIGFTISLIVETPVVLHELLINKENNFETALSSHEVKVAVWMYYIILILGFSKFGLISLITNICFCVYTNRRIADLIKPNTENQVPTSVPVPYGPGAVQVFPMTQQYGFPTPQQQGYPMPQSFKPVKPQPTHMTSYGAKK